LLYSHFNWDAILIFDGKRHEAYYALRELFEPGTEKRKIIDFIIFEEEEAQKKSSQPIDF
jgi:hypothetical protein